MFVSDYDGLKNLQADFYKRIGQNNSITYISFLPNQFNTLSHQIELASFLFKIPISKA